MRRRIARGIYALAEWVNPSYDWSVLDTNETQGWEASFYFEANEREAYDAFDRLIDATCGSDHHPLDPCTGPNFVGGLHPASLEEDES